MEMLWKMSLTTVFPIKQIWGNLHLLDPLTSAPDSSYLLNLIWVGAPAHILHVVQDCTTNHEKGNFIDLKEQQISNRISQSVS